MLSSVWLRNSYVFFLGRTKEKIGGKRKKRKKKKSGKDCPVCGEEKK